MRNFMNRAALLGALLLASAFAQAQFAWIDEKGVRHYSDQPPPPNTPDAKILKMPRGMVQPAPAATAAPAAAPTPPTKPPATLAEREADYAKRHALAAANDKKAAAESQNADAKRALCASAAKDKALLDTGRRLRDEKNVVMTEADKAKELANVDKILKECK